MAVPVASRRRNPAVWAAVSVMAVVAGCASTTGPTVHASSSGSSTRTSISATSATAAGVRQVSVGVGSPPLKGTLTVPAGKGPFPGVVLVSGSGPNDQDETVGPNKPFLDIALDLAARGIVTLRYDKRTLDYPHDIDLTTFTPTQEYVPDALTAIGLLEHDPEVNPHLIFVLGHSQGGTYAPLIAKNAPKVAGVILLAASTESTGAALLRQVRYLATLPGTIGSQAKAELPAVTKLAAEIDNRATLEKDEKDDPGTNFIGGTSPAYYLSELSYDEVATARAIPQPLLLLQGDRDYQVTVANDLDVWAKGLKGREGVTVVQFPEADHLFLDGTGAPTPVEYETAGHVDPKVISTIAGWVARVAKSKSGAASTSAIGTHCTTLTLSDTQPQPSAQVGIGACLDVVVPAWPTGHPTDVTVSPADVLHEDASVLQSDGSRLTTFTARTAGTAHLSATITPPTDAMMPAWGGRVTVTSG